MNQNNREYLKLLESYQGKKVLLVLKNTFRYETSDLKVLADMGAVHFTDKKGYRMLVSIEEIAQILEVKQ